MIKKYLWMFLLAAGAQTGLGFALLGPLNPPGTADSWQSPVIGYDLGTDVGSPRDVGQGYRRNVPVIYYAYDPSYLVFFGSNGVVAVDSAVAIMNSLTNVDNLDPTQFPFDSQGFNPTAAALYMFDVKSTTLALLVEQMGLAQPERYTWTLQDRIPGVVCPDDYSYVVVQRNFEVTNTALNQIQYSSYVNNVLYTYSIIEECTGPNPLAYTVAQAFDPAADQYTSVAASFGSDTYTGGGLQFGGYYTGLTYDDVAGLKYLLTTNINNVHLEHVTGSELFTATTNFAGPETLFPSNSNSPTLYGTFDLGSLLSSATTNSPAQVMANFPGVVANPVGDGNYYIWATNATVTAYYTNYIGSPAGSPQILVYATNYTYGPLEKYVTSFANIVTNYYQSNRTAILQTITTGPLVGGSASSPYVSITNNQIITLTNQPAGSFYVLPSYGSNFCPAGIMYTLGSSVIFTTNSLAILPTNTAAATGGGTTTTTTNVQSIVQNLITWYTNYTYVAYTVNCAQASDAVNLYQGIGRVQFVRRDYDSLLGQFFVPVTFEYSMVALTNSRYLTQNFQRTLVAPELMVEANDLNDVTYVTRNAQFDTTEAIAGLAGPGVIIGNQANQANPTTVITFNTDVNAVDNAWPSGQNGFINPNQETQEFPPYLTWASYDGTTNDPVLYPSGQNIANLASQMLIQISPASLPPGTNGQPYSARFTVVNQTRLTPVMTWSATGLPPGLTLTNYPAPPVTAATQPLLVNGATTGVLSGTPIDQTGGSNSPLIYDATIILTDATGNSVQWYYPITIQ